MQCAIRTKNPEMTVPVNIHHFSLPYCTELFHVPIPMAACMIKCFIQSYLMYVYMEVCLLPNLLSVSTCRSYGQNQSPGGCDSPFVNNVSETGHVLSGSITRLNAHLEFGPPEEPTYGGSIMSQSTVQSQSTFRTQSSHNLIQAKYSGVQHHWLNQGFSQDTPEDQRRRDFIRGLTDIDDTDSLVAESVASTYV